MNPYKFNPVLTKVGDGVYYDVTYTEYDAGRYATYSQTFRTYEAAKEFFNAIPLS